MSSKLFFKAIAIGVFCSSCLTAHSLAVNGQDIDKLNTSVKCTIGVLPGKIIAGFPILDDKQEIWTWNKKDFQVGGNYYYHSIYNFDYLWIIDLGVMKNGKFEPTKYTFGVGHLNRYNFLKNETNGTIADLIESMKAFPGSIYLNEALKKNKDDLKTRDFPIYIDYGDETVMVYSKSPEAINILLSERPTFAKMTMRTPYPPQSYSCLTKIYYKQASDVAPTP